MSTQISGSLITTPSIDLATPLAVVDGGTGGSTNTPLMTNIRFTSAEQTITSAGTLTIAHGLGVVPFHVSYLLKCTTAEFGYSIGDLVVYNHAQTSSSAVDTYGLSSKIDLTNINIKFGSTATTTLATTSFTTGIAVALTNANWKLIVKAEA